MDFHINKSFIRVNKTTISIVLFLAIFMLIHNMKPTLFYTPEGGFREFGVGYKQKTVVPIWLAAIFIAILCYLSVMYLLIIV
jgi:hypothetical protein